MSEISLSIHASCSGVGAGTGAPPPLTQSAVSCVLVMRFAAASKAKRPHPSALHA